jgi:AcrR family transcriptional regulator
MGGDAVTAAKRSPDAAGDATRRRFIVAAERLFARKGLDAVSVRDITSAAKANTASIHYHFGSKQGLIRAILAYRAADLGERRANYLDTLERKAKPTLRDVVRAFVLPTYELSSDRRHGGQNYVAFLAAVLSHPEYMPLVIDAYQPQTSRYRAMLERVTPHLSPEVREFRWAIAKDLVNRTLSNPHGPVQQWLERQTGEHGDEPLTDRLVDFLTGAFAAKDLTFPAR